MPTPHHPHPPPPSPSSPPAPELRLQIYHHACHPRVTTLIYQEDAGSTTGTGTFRCPTHPQPSCTSRASPAPKAAAYIPHPHPNLNNGTNTNQFDSGSGFGFAHSGGMSMSMSMSMGYASWACDFATTLLPDVARAVRRLAVDYVPGEVRRPWEVYGKVCLLRGCARLEEAFLVVGRSQQSHTLWSSSDSRRARTTKWEGEGEGAEVEFVDPGGMTGRLWGLWSG
ncbi:hypothetical protein NEMBOFW57_006626 [Staphylotrichum longicolle]|uniref:Uncharacterized protein n=1 Tax=Staphylotrichum longicolle TaxID=669026 RepID=A0AAD4ETI6_9PEZI|nr:hypothetical protein NEMBOFW57_006626 [Staphylotrichum longicolle]